MALSRKELDFMECQYEGCDHTNHRHMYLHSRCHRNAGTEVEYDRVTGELSIYCVRCKNHITTIKVAAE